MSLADIKWFGTLTNFPVAYMPGSLYTGWPTKTQCTLFIGKLSQCAKDTFVLQTKQRTQNTIVKDMRSQNYIQYDWIPVSFNSSKNNTQWIESATLP